MTTSGKVTWFNDEKIAMAVQTGLWITGFIVFEQGTNIFVKGKINRIRFGIFLGKNHLRVLRFKSLKPNSSFHVIHFGLSDCLETKEFLITLWNIKCKILLVDALLRCSYMAPKCIYSNQEPSFGYSRDIINHGLPHPIFKNGLCLHHHKITIKFIKVFLFV